MGVPKIFIICPEPHPSRQNAAKAVLEAEVGMQVIIQWPKKQRKQTLNDAMWAGPLRDIERMAWFQGRQYDAKIWHEYYKEKFLPDENDPDFDPSHVLSGYHKWRHNPFKDTRELTGSTSQLTDKGMRTYIMEMEADAAQEFQVIFTVAFEPSGRCRD